MNLSTSDVSSIRTRRFAGRFVGIGIVTATVAIALYVVSVYDLYPLTDDAYVRANVVGIAPRVQGPIVELPVIDNQHVNKGDLLFTVDPRPYQAALDLAQAKLELTNLEIKAYQDSIHAARARQTQLEADAAYDQQYLNRIVPLLPDEFVTANDVANAKSKLKASSAAVTNAQSEVQKAQNQLGQIGDINARRKAAEASVYDAKLNVDYCYVRAPFDAYVTNLNIAVGQYANVGREVMSLVDNRQWYVMANFRENFLPRIDIGMGAKIYLFSYPGHAFRGKVEGVGWALYQGNGATISGLPEVKPTLNWVRLSQRFPVRIILDEPDSKHPFRMGETAVVTIQGFKQ